MNYEIKFTKAAVKDLQKLKNANLGSQAKKILSIMEKDPLTYPPEFEQLKGNLAGYYSRRLNKKHRIIYKIEGCYIYIYAMWSHYETF